jgi:hypothetical protein
MCRDFKDDISVISELFAPSVGHLSVECVLPFRCFVLHLPFQVRVVLGLITFGLVSVLIWCL